MINLNLKKIVAGVGVVCAFAGADLNAQFEVRTSAGSDKTFATETDGSLSDATENKSKLDLQRVRLDFEKVMGDFSVAWRLGDSIDEIKNGPSVAKGTFKLHEMASVSFGKFIPVATANYLSTISANGYNTAFSTAMGTRYSVDGYNYENYSDANVASNIGVQVAGDNIMVVDNSCLAYEASIWESYDEENGNLNYSKKMAAAARLGGVFHSDMGSVALHGSVAQVPENITTDSDGAGANPVTYDKTRYYNLGFNLAAQGFFAEGEYSKKTYKDTAATPADKNNSAWRAIGGFGFLGAKREAGVFSISDVKMAKSDKMSALSMDCHSAEAFAHYSQNDVALLANVLNNKSLAKADSTYGAGVNYFVGPMSIKGDYTIAKFDNTVDTSPADKQDGHFFTLRLDMKV